MNDWLNGKTREEQIQDDTDKYQMMDCTILGSASIIKGLQWLPVLRRACAAAMLVEVTDERKTSMEIWCRHNISNLHSPLLRIRPYTHRIHNKIIRLLY